MNTYHVTDILDFGSTEAIEAASADDAIDYYLSSGNYDTTHGPALCLIRAENQDDEDDVTQRYVTYQRDEPECTDYDGHQWCSPHSVVGGLEENPGVFGHGGGVTTTVVCRHCGVYRVTDTWHQVDINGMVWPEEVITYREADDASLVFVASQI